jgi:2-keto-4-pentenoate hydratase/2-oxohepta-3-ene-1,7-dioic acid hydratase in catechol pathway
MKLATIVDGTTDRVGAVDPGAGTVRIVTQVGRKPVTTMLDVIEGVGAGGATIGHGATVRLDQVRLGPPIPRPRRNILCVGKNYHEHAREFARSGFDGSTAAVSDDVPAAPIIFTKFPETVIATGEVIRCPEALAQALDYEAELAVIIGRAGKAIPRHRAAEHVFGYAITNDVTARDLQKKHVQWFLGKSIDGFCPFGPWITTADEVDAGNLGLRCWVNGELRQRANTRDLIFDIPTLIATISDGIRLFPGDIISTGTPVGVGIGFDPPRFLKPGDVVTIEIDGLGKLENTVG